MCAVTLADPDGFANDIDTFDIIGGGGHTILFVPRMKDTHPKMFAQNEIYAFFKTSRN